MRIVIVNSGVGNVRSVANMLRRLGVQSAISDSAAEIGQADALILPGVGSFDAALRRLRGAGLVERLEEKVIGGRTPVLGLCLGMQLLGDSSEEGSERGFGWIPGRLRKLAPIGDNGVRLKVPHMGWNVVDETDGCALYQGMEASPRFYFDHSYYFVPEQMEHTCGTVHHGMRFAAGVQRDNVFGVQFHPEKSHRFGLALLGNFVAIARAAYGRARRGEESVDEMGR